MVHTIVDPGPSFRMQRLWILWRHEYDISDANPLSTHYRRVSATWRHQWRHQSTRHLHFSIRHEPINCLVSEILSIKVADGRIDRQTDMSTDNKGRLKRSSRLTLTRSGTVCLVLLWIVICISSYTSACVCADVPMCTDACFIWTPRYRVYCQTL